MMYCIQYSTLAPLLIKVKQKGKSDGNLLTILQTAVSAYLWLYCHLPRAPRRRNGLSALHRGYKPLVYRFEQTASCFYWHWLGQCPQQ